MFGIDYEVSNSLADAQLVVFTLLAHISNHNGNRQRFQAMLLMQFGILGKLTLWHEVYVPLPAH